MKIAIFGGSFNPPHRMHEKIGLHLIENRIVDKVVYVPTGNKYNKKDLISAEHRYNMLKLMCAGKENLYVSDYELKNELIYTYQTLDYFKNIYVNDEIYFICGTDNFKVFHTWKNYEYILKNYKILVINRNNDKINQIIDNMKYKDKVIEINISQDDISATKIREYIKNGNYDVIKDFLNVRVFEYIKENMLYNY